MVLMNTKTKRPELTARVKIHEGKISHAYQDPYGYWTIGYGRLIDKNKGGRLTDDEMEYLLANDLHRYEQELRAFPWFQMQGEVRKEVLIELSFNMGLPNLLGFKRMIAALKNRDYENACKELLDSKWARQDVGASRVADIKYRLQYGKYR